LQHRRPYEADIVQEAGIAHEVTQVCPRTSETHGAVRATAVCLRVGAVASVDPDAVTFSFDALQRDTRLAAVTLHIEWRSRFGRGASIPSIPAWRELATPSTLPDGRSRG
jgi:hypothetical protein